MKKLVIIYDERIRPGDEIREITGEKSFSGIIYKRRTLESIMDAEIREAAEKLKIPVKTLHWDGFKDPEMDEGERHSKALLIFSDCVVLSKKEFEVVLKKSLYTEESYRIMAGENVACVLYKDMEAFLSDSALDSPALKTKSMDYENAESGAFSDISGKDAFLAFITGGFEARFFNSLSGDEYTVVKKSGNKKKIRSEYRFYELLPDNMKGWFVQPYDFKEDEKEASYRMQRYHMTDLAIRYVHGAISVEEFKKILELLFVFLSERKEEEVSWNEFYERRRDLYILKVEKRIAELKQHPDFPKLEEHIKNGTAYNGIDSIVKAYEDLYDKMAGSVKEKLCKTASHGDLCFSNILYSPDAFLMRFVDPKGAESEEELYSDPLYDIAKLSHSISGQYDFMNSALFGIEVTDDLKLKLSIDGDITEYRRMFEDKLKEKGIDVPTVRLFECSLFLSMLPLHMDRPKKVLSFILNAILILQELSTP